MHAVVTALRALLAEPGHITRAEVAAVLALVPPTPGAGVPVVDVVIEYKKPGDVGWVRIEAPLTTGFTVGGLLPQTTYDYRVAWRDHLGQVGEFSDVLTTTTPATAAVTPPGAPTVTFQVLPDAPTPAQALRINCGGTMTLHDGESFVADTYAVGGTSYRADFGQPELYKTDRNGVGSSPVYTLPTGTGTTSNVRVRLHFCELFLHQVGRRVFDVLINGAVYLDDFDISALTSARGVPLVRDVVIAPTDEVVVSFFALSDVASICGIEILDAADSPLSQPVLSKPGPMTAASASIPAAGTVRLTDTLPAYDGGSPLTAIRRTVGATVRTTAPSVRSDDFTGLADGTYPWSVAAVNAQGTGPASTGSITVGAGVVTVGVRTTPASPVRRAQECNDAYYLCTHLTYGNVYQNRPLLASCLNYLLCWNLRDGWGTANASASLRAAIAAFLNDTIRANGGQLCLVQDMDDWVGGTTPAQMIALHKELGYHDLIFAVEGDNEPDLSNQIELARSRTESIMAAYAADPASAHIWRGMPSLADTNTDSKYQALAANGGMPSVQVGVGHPYPGVDRQMSGPSSNTDSGYAINNTMGRNLRYPIPTPSGTPLKALYTEHGFSSGTTGDGGKNMPDAARATQELRVWLESFRGIGGGDRALDVLLTAQYELIDQDPNSSNTEARFGLFTNDGTPKLPAVVIRRARLINQDSSPDALSFSPTDLGFTLSGGDADTRTLLLQKTNGSWVLWVWQEWLTWNGSTILNPTPRNVTLTLPSSRTISRFSPVTTDAETALGSGTSFALQSGANAIALKVA